MSIQQLLSKHGSKRMVVLTPETTVYDAARALEANHIGVIVVSDGNGVSGIVTDRDIALRVTGYGLDGGDLTLHDIMTRDVATLPPSATEADAAQLMLDRHVRRIPIVDEGSVVGLVTLDDLVLRQFDPIMLAQIVWVQLAEPAALKDKGEVHPTAPVHGAARAPSTAERASQRHAARATATYMTFIRRVLDDTKLESQDKAEAALDTLLAGMIQRITPEESDHLMSQLPAVLRERLSAVPRGPARNITRAWVEHQLSERLGVDEARASDLAGRLGHALQTTLDQGVLADVTAQLPQDMRGIFSPAHP